MLLKNAQEDLSNLIEQLALPDIEYVIFGAGTTSLEFLAFLQKMNLSRKVRYIVDNDPEKQGKILEGFSIKSPQELSSKSNNLKIIIGSMSYYLDIKKQLENMGFQFNMDFFYYRDIVPLALWIEKKELWLNKTNLSITEKCNLRCKNCSMLMPLFENPTELSFNEIVQDVDAYFKVVDGVREFTILGGEPFLHPDLARIVEYIGEKYGDRIQFLQLNTNATVVLTKKMLETMQHFQVRVLVSDYSNVINYSDRLDRFVNDLASYNIDYVKLGLGNWIDYGSPYEARGLTSKELISFFDNCITPCRTLYHKKLYYCFRNCAAVRARIFDDNENDYFALEFNGQQRQDYQQKLLQFDLGYIKEGYITFCDHCKGEFALNDSLVKAGEQISK